MVYRQVEIDYIDDWYTFDININEKCDTTWDGTNPKSMVYWILGNYANNVYICTKNLITYY
jgi:hypothetical protein